MSFEHLYEGRCLPKPWGRQAYAVSGLLCFHMEVMAQSPWLAEDTFNDTLGQLQAILPDLDVDSLRIALAE